MRLSRRQLLRQALALALLPWAHSPVQPQDVSRRWKHQPFALGVASGSPRADGVVLWTRLLIDEADRQSTASEPVLVRWELFADEALQRLVRQGEATTDATRGHSVHVPLQGLEPGREYWYRFSCGDALSRVGRTRTAPAPDAPVQRLRLGSLAFGQAGLDDVQVPAEALEAQVHLFDGRRWLASFALSEDLREDAIATLERLRHLGLSVQVLSGDRPAAVAALAARVGLPPEAARGGCSPNDKWQHLEALQQAGHRVLMVGDGLNDGPVMAAAHVSMAVGGAVPLTQARADLVLMGDHLEQVAQTLVLSQRTLTVVRQNLAWAAFYNALCVPLAMLGWLPAWLAGLGMALSSIGVVLHSLRLGRPLARDHIPLRSASGSRLAVQTA